MSSIAEVCGFCVTTSKKGRPEQNVLHPGGFDLMER